MEFEEKLKPTAGENAEGLASSLFALVTKLLPEHFPKKNPEEVAPEADKKDEFGFLKLANQKQPSVDADQVDADPEIEVGGTYQGEILSIKSFGMFVGVPGVLKGSESRRRKSRHSLVEGLVHISRVSGRRLDSIE